ncbi:MAG: 2-amino-4-hydroxy-6-hydroxymethyldihydropteridine diphosphokinase [Candidatus Omnitrophota bacterium]|nr:MAG: 2-amino-4-hydroxy-6-hydroxymethyldihydropteridine diphosphokinase [Candidatus Omnitrophota bacterium]
MRNSKVYLGIGSNLGNRNKNINTAIKRLGGIEGIEVTRVSSLIETEPEGGPPQNKFLNGAIEIKTKLLPHELLKQLKRIEEELGRVKTIKNGPRTIDLDILLYGDEKINSPDLKIPHPRMYKREFVMRPLKELQCISHL